MAVSTQYNPNDALNRILQASGLSKTVYALVTPEIEETKQDVFESSDYYARFQRAWTGKQDAFHEEFFAAWESWSEPVVQFDKGRFMFSYPTSGASEAIRQLIFDHAVLHSVSRPTIHVFEGEYEGYRAMAEAAMLLDVKEHARGDWQSVSRHMKSNDLFFISAPSAIDGNVWEHFNAFVQTMPVDSVVADMTYVGATGPVSERFNLNADAIRAVVFSLSKPFGAYYDRIGGVYTKTSSETLFGNRWFKNLTSLAVGTSLMKKYNVFYMKENYGFLQRASTSVAADALGCTLMPSDVFILAHGQPSDDEMGRYLSRGSSMRVCLTPHMYG